MPEEKPESSHSDLSKDMQFPGSEYENMEGESHSTAKEGELLTPEEDKNQLKNIAEEAKGKVAPEDGTKKTTLEEDEKSGGDQAAG